MGFREYDDSDPDMQIGGVGKSRMGCRKGFQTGGKTQVQGVREQAISKGSRLSRKYHINLEEITRHPMVVKVKKKKKEKKKGTPGFRSIGKKREQYQDLRTN